FCAALGSYFGGGAWWGVLAAIGGGIVMSLLYGVATIRFRADQVVIGIAINLMAVGATRFFLRLVFDSAANSPRVAGFGDRESATGFAALMTNPMFWMAVLTVVLVSFLLYRTPFGLRVRA